MLVSQKRDGLQDLKDLDEVCRALAHPSRRHILVVMKARGGQMTAGDIAKRFSCSWPTTSRHLKQLEEAGLLEVERRGREWVYGLNLRRLTAVMGNWLKYFEGGE